MRLRFTLLADGTSDRLLLFPIRWALRRMNVAIEQEHWADLSLAHPKPRTLAERAIQAVDLYPAQLLFVHRDAEGLGRDERIREVSGAVASPHVPVVPVRMTEAWLLHDEPAIRRASGNPSGKIVLDLPAPSCVEALPDPKTVLRDALVAASELSGRRRASKVREFAVMRARVAELIDDFEPLRVAPAFACFLEALERALVDLGRPTRVS